MSDTDEAPPSLETLIGKAGGPLNLLRSANLGAHGWDRDFLGKAALKEKKTNQRRTKATLVWNDDDTAKIITDSLYGRGGGALRMRLPMPMHATFQADAVLKTAPPSASPPRSPSRR